MGTMIPGRKERETNCEKGSKYHPEWKARKNKEINVCATLSSREKLKVEEEEEKKEFILPNPVICIEQKGEMGFEDQIRLKFKHKVETKSSPAARSL